MADAKEIGKVLRQLEYGVYVVTMGKGQSGNAFTASWLGQVSSEPPMVSVSVKSSHRSTPMLKEAGGFAVNLIGEGQEAVAKAYFGPAESGHDKLASSVVKDAPVTGSPLLSGTIGYLDCKLVKEIEVGNHTIFVGEVVAAEINGDSKILTTTSSKLVYTG